MEVRMNVERQYIRMATMTGVIMSMINAMTKALLDLVVITVVVMARLMACASIGAGCETHLAETKIYIKFMQDHQDGDCPWGKEEDSLGPLSSFANSWPIKSKKEISMTVTKFVNGFLKNHDPGILYLQKNMLMVHSSHSHLYFCRQMCILLQA
ncbi:hypothetical protein BDA99DRAFT_531358 [Phascolomyces articulosus]|uniref:Uncharacterized protein n=1 Tax=Phascolomyces articulosus TaxID=60185 RepID=A0AAD5KCF6_9FUNG|nr:hypothetical protein BDA99DRAFT_531358 [Phascolomyces articulosus]